MPCHLLTASGRTVARTPSAAAIPVPRAAAAVDGTARGGLTLRVAAESSPYDAWHLHLHLPDADAAPPRVLHEIAEVFARTATAGPGGPRPPGRPACGWCR
ncbi:hypothetical protein [Streptomyces sp. WAC06614]|uniref:hypothetical protein n=1 Tax=Streptomyces sp. WAC06614 TaxID=2487416 RepID=UPI000F76AB87|nr:hypothetical protein [Streptomyces sp. WAC06614]RSS63940.1 hypothetical protein EF918_30650 [Streptomyces sp. WAC06614]